jgi:membrane protein required for colicin V production
VTIFDYVVLAVIGLSVLVSIFRGAVREVMALASWIGSGFVAIQFSPSVSGVLPSAISNPTIRIAVAFVVLLLISLLLFALVSLAVSNLAKKAGLSSIDRIVGAFFGLLRGIVVLVLLVLVAGLTPLPRDPAWRNATFSPPLEALAIFARGFLPEPFAARIRYE